MRVTVNVPSIFSARNFTLLPVEQRGVLYVEDLAQIALVKRAGSLCGAFPPRLSRDLEVDHHAPVFVLQVVAVEHVDLIAVE